jgi:hypothetical protein
MIGTRLHCTQKQDARHHVRGSVAGAPRLAFPRACARGSGIPIVRYASVDRSLLLLDGSLLLLNRSISRSLLTLMHAPLQPFSELSSNVLALVT